MKRRDLGSAADDAEDDGDDDDEGHQRQRDHQHQLHLAAASVYATRPTDRPEYKTEEINKQDSTPCLVPPQFPKSCYSTCHIECLWPVHGALNVDEKKN